MSGFRLFLIIVLGVIAIYTGTVGIHHGWNILPIFFGDILAMTWPGQFNLDFFCFLLLSGLWVAWRHKFSVSGTLLGLVAVFGGMFFLSGYLLMLTLQEHGDLERILFGRAAH